MRKIAPGLALSVLLAVSVTLALELPPPPEGYSWQECSEMKGALLVPAGWHFQAMQGVDKLAYFITKEPFEAPESYEIGISLNVMKDIPGKLGMSPSAFAVSYVDRARETKATERTWDSSMGAFYARGIVYSDAGPVSLKVYNLVISNDRTGTAYLVIFEAPAEAWDAEWPVAEVVLQRLLIDDEI